MIGGGFAQVGALARGYIVSNYSSLDACIREDEKRLMSAGGALCRFGSVQTDDNCPVFVWTMHHTIYDAASVELTMTGHRGSSLSKTS